MTERFSAREAIALAGDDFRELPLPMREFKPDGPLSWQGYDDSRRRALTRTGEDESVVCGTAVIGSTRVVLIAFEFGFLGGSLGERTGDRVEAAYTHARAHRLPVVSLVATGGSRMQEGMLALTQLQRVARQSTLAREEGLPQIAVLRDPTTGGGWATLGAGADVTLALPGAQVGFAGSRVRPPDADPAAYTAEAQVAAGAVDAVVREEQLRETLALWLTLLTAPGAKPGLEAGPKPGAGAEAKPGPDAGAGPEAEAKPRAGVESESGTGTGPEAGAGAEPGPEPGAEAGPEPGAEAGP
ncbi:carboxyl transferase domain-containing protein, partial [Streptomyces sp. NPDC005388]|uniref:carboxyl transferase domain-containing protein n=1 Tax=Streptomyces sp. NPDC005388 TaxID=3156717 RepID=UPI0033B5D529